MKNGVALYGGFSGIEQNRVDRNWVVHQTILSCDIRTHGDDTGNAYHVLYQPSDTTLDGSAIVDGFTITGGNADGAWPHGSGGGMFNETGRPTVSNCTFESNSAAGAGGGMYIRDGSPAVNDVTSSGNSAANGGGMAQLPSFICAPHCSAVAAVTHCP
jgi:hypothetical protein